MINTARKFALVTTLTLGAVAVPAGLAAAATAPQASAPHASSLPHTGMWTCCLPTDGTVCFVVGSPEPFTCPEGWVSVDLDVDVNVDVLGPVGIVL